MSKINLWIYILVVSYIVGTIVLSVLSQKMKNNDVIDKIGAFMMPAFLVGCFILILLGRKEGRYEWDTFMRKGEMTIGVFQGYRGSSSGGAGGYAVTTTTYTMFIYYIDGEEIYGENPPFTFYTQKVSDLKKGDRFLVLYDKQKQNKNAIILLDHPIRDSADFKRYVEEIELMRKRN